MIRKEYEVRNEGKWARKKESRRPSYAGVPGCRKYPTISFSVMRRNLMFNTTLTHKAIGFGRGMGMKHPQW